MFHLWLRFITFGGLSAHLAYHVQKVAVDINHHHHLIDRQIDSNLVKLEKGSNNFVKLSLVSHKGSMLWPFLYLLYVNDISGCTERHMLSFADNTRLFLSDSDPKNLFEKANIETNKLFSWFCTNRRLLNSQKTKFILIKAKFDLNSLNL